jgi:four helix bundle protein
MPELDRSEEKSLAAVLDHENLDVYRVSLEFVGFIYNLVDVLSSSTKTRHLADQLRRVSSSVPGNIAEGTGKVSAKDKSHYYAIAKGSAAECGAHLDVLKTIGSITAMEHHRAKLYVGRLVAMLVKLAQSMDERA